MVKVGLFIKKLKEANVNFSIDCIEERPLRKGKNWSYYFGQPSNAEKEYIKEIGEECGLKGIKFYKPREEGTLPRVTFTTEGKYYPRD